MVAAKSLLATALLALVCSGVALADNLTVRIQRPDQARAVAALLRESDFGIGWEGGPTKTTPLQAPRCPGFSSAQPKLVVSGHADAKFTFPPGGVVLEQDVEVLASPAAVRDDFSHTITPKLPPCLAYELEHSANVVRAVVEKIPFPPTGSVSAAYQATVVVRGAQLKGVLLSDFIYFGDGRIEYSFNVVAPLAARDQLGRFELALAQILLKRAASAHA